MKKLFCDKCGKDYHVCTYELPRCFLTTYYNDFKLQQFDLCEVCLVGLIRVATEYLNINKL